MEIWLPASAAACVCGGAGTQLNSAAGRELWCLISPRMDGWFISPAFLRLIVFVCVLVVICVLWSDSTQCQGGRESRKSL